MELNQRKADLIIRLVKDSSCTSPSSAASSARRRARVNRFIMPSVLCDRFNSCDTLFNITQQVAHWYLTVSAHNQIRTRACSFETMTPTMFNIILTSQSWRNLQRGIRPMPSGSKMRQASTKLTRWESCSRNRPCHKLSNRPYSSKDWARDYQCT